jgi:prepilin-type N-terminal cleavage/methylation domain-containing protein
METRFCKGFTLVEIAMVLVVVGLLMGGVLKGQEMITNAKLKRIESDFAGLAAATFSYQDRYLQLPGDDSKAFQRFNMYSNAALVNGDGDGIIDGDWNVAATGNIDAGGGTEETGKFFAHLRAAGLIAGGGIDDTKPTNAYGGQVGIRDGSLGIAGHVLIFGLIEGTVSKIIEARLDDGEPSAGRIQSGMASGGSPVDMNTASSGSLTYQSSERYNIAFRM